MLAAATLSRCYSSTGAARFVTELLAPAVSHCDSGVRLSRFVAERLRMRDGGAVPPALLRKWLRRGQLRVSGSEAFLSLQHDSPLAHGSQVLGDREVAGLVRPHSVIARPVSHAQTIDVAAWLRHVDDDVVVVSKPASFATQGGGDGPCLDDVLPLLAAHVGSDRLRLAHRLDRGVSGLLALGRTRSATAAVTAGLRASSVATSEWADAVAAAMSAGGGSAALPTLPTPPRGCLRKGYVGLVLAPSPPALPPADGLWHPWPSKGLRAASVRPLVRMDVPFASAGDISTRESSGTIIAPVAHLCERSGRVVEATAVSRFAVATVVGSAPQQRVLCALLLEPLTGRKHQLRQHVARVLFAGHASIEGDGRYGGQPRQGAASHLHLHAAALRLRVAPNGVAVSVDDALPLRMRTLLESHGVTASRVQAALAAFVSSSS